MTFVCLFISDAETAASFTASASVTLKFRTFAHLQKVSIQFLDILLSEALKDECFQASTGPRTSAWSSDYPDNTVQVPLVSMTYQDVGDGEGLLPVELVLLEVGCR